jgi:hypothetical protein
MRTSTGAAPQARAPEPGVTGSVFRERTLTGY